MTKLAARGIFQLAMLVITFPVAGAAQSIVAGSSGLTNPCLLTSPPAVVCWGKAHSQPANPVPSSVAGLPNDVIQISDGGLGSCALTSGGDVWCWGDNSVGQLGRPNGIQPSGPQRISGLPSGVVEIAAGGDTYCARTSAGAVWCWGDNSYGEINSGNSTPYSYEAFQIPGLPVGAAGIAAGLFHICAAYGQTTSTTPGSVWCWGSNNYGQAGNSSVGQSNGPTQVAGLPAAIPGSAVALKLSAGSRHTCAITSSGAVWCWGGNASGQLGNGSTTNSFTPVQVSGLSGAASISAGANHTCATTTMGKAWCWGENSAGQLGNGTTTPSPVPVQVSGSANGMLAIAAGTSYTCALTSERVPECWGSNASGQLGHAGGPPSTTPVPVVFESGTWILGTLNNGSGKTATVNNDAAPTVGVVFAGLGVLGIEYRGPAIQCAHPHWWAHVTWGERTWEFYFDTGTRLDINVDGNANFTFKPDSTGQVVNGGQPPVCH